MINMIILIAGDFAVGKDTFADELNTQMHYRGMDSYKILSKTTRNPRYKDENTHIFTDKLEYQIDFLDQQILAETQIANNYYWTTKKQFNHDYNIYVVDSKGVTDMEKTHHTCFKILIERPNNKKTPRTQRKRHTEWDNNIKYNYIINNDSTIENLKKQTQLVIKAIKQYEQDLQKIRDKKYNVLINHVLNNHLKNKNNKKGE